MAEGALFRVKIKSPRRIRMTAAQAVRRQLEQCRMKLVMAAPVREGLGEQADRPGETRTW